MTNDAPQPEQGELLDTPAEAATGPRQVDAVVALAETMALVVSSLLELMPPYPVKEGDVMTIAKLNKAQEMMGMGMHQLHTLLALMGSPMVSGPPETSAPVPPPAPSGIIIPGR